VLHHDCQHTTGQVLTETLRVKVLSGAEVFCHAELICSLRPQQREIRTERAMVAQGFRSADDEPGGVCQPEIVVAWLGRRHELHSSRLQSRESGADRPIYLTARAHEPSLWNADAPTADICLRLF